MIVIKTREQIEILREGGKRLASILHAVSLKVVPGVSTYELDQYAQKLIKEMGDMPAFLNYTPEGALYAFPGALCTSVNGEVVHGIPKKDVILKEGDIISIDLGIKHKGLFTDHAMTVPVGEISEAKKKLLDVTEKSLYIGIEQAIVGNKVGAIGHAIQSFIKPHKYGIIEELAGHGVGVSIHEDPYIPNYGKSTSGEVLKPGMVIAIEPMINLGSKYITFLEDGYTIKTQDGKPSAHFEHTVLITEQGPEILTK